MGTLGRDSEEGVYDSSLRERQRSVYGVNWLQLWLHLLVSDCTGKRLEGKNPRWKQSPASLGVEGEMMPWKRGGRACGVSKC